MNNNGSDDWELREMEKLLNFYPYRVKISINPYGHQFQNKIVFIRKERSVVYKSVPLDAIFPSAEAVMLYLQSFIDKSIKWNLLFFYHECMDAFHRFQNTLLDLETDDSFPKEKWKKELRNIEKQLILKVSDNIIGGVDNLNINLSEEIQREIDRLEPMAGFYYNPETNHLTEIQSSLRELQSQIQGDLKNNSRVTFKLIQELQTQLEEFSQNTNQPQEDLAADAVSQSAKQLDKLKLVTLEIFDMLDLVYQASKQINNPTWTKEIENAVQKVLTILANNGLAEIAVEGKLTNGEVMEVIGTVPKQDVPDEYQLYQVYAVHQRGFMDKSTGKVIRRAKVTTVL
ncbi:nucleotide exchange factor GrpE [Neobacillus dielmonensis]|uniref:nucleotide exchange factor GrpE n=1 Tax=Neobacillus dielmonensis TaxID=1347369 RepID=UPI0005AB2F0A|nr:nucleotide exchange factor GrpE [Neobacillus dielmonensis]